MKKSLEVNNLSRVIAGKKNLSPIVNNINKTLNLYNIKSKINSKKKLDCQIYHFGGFAMLYKRIFFGKSIKDIVIFHGTDLHGYINDLSIISKLKYYLNYISNLILMFLVDDIIVVSNSLFKFVPNRFKAKTSILFLGVDENLNVFNKQKKKINFASFVNNNNRGLKNIDLANSIAYNYKLKLNTLQGLDYKSFIKELSYSSHIIISSFAEGSPNVLKEAIILNVNPIVVDVGDCKDIIERYGGILVDYNSNLLKKYDGQKKYTIKYLSLERTVNQLKYFIKIN